MKMTIAQVMTFFNILITSRSRNGGLRQLTTA
jgi:hypothetical protein